MKIAECASNTLKVAILRSLFCVLKVVIKISLHYVTIGGVTGGVTEVYKIRRTQKMQNPNVLEKVVKSVSSSNAIHSHRLVTFV